MTNKVLAFLSASILVGALSVPLSAQTMTLKANIPFQFSVQGKTMPAGQYLIQRDGGSQFVRLSDRAADTSVIVRVSSSATLDNGARNEAKIYFDKYGNQYFLHGIWDGYMDGGVLMPKTHAERELSHSASLGQPETTAVLARL